MKKILAGASLLLFPVVSLAQVNTRNIESSIQALTRVGNLLVYLFLAIAVLVFVVGVIRYVLNRGGEESKKAGRDYMIWGIIGITVILSVFALANLLIGLFGLQPNRTNNINIPQVPTNGNSGFQFVN